MIIVFQGTAVVFPGATQEGMNILAGTMQHAVAKWHADGKPPSGDRM